MAAEAEAQRRGADDAVFVDATGSCSRARSTNVWWRRGAHALHAVARARHPRRRDAGRRCSRLAGGLGYEVARGRVRARPSSRAPTRRSRSSSVREVMPVVELDGRRSATAARPAARAPGRAARSTGRAHASRDDTSRPRYRVSASREEKVQAGRRWRSRTASLVPRPDRLVGMAPTRARHGPAGGASRTACVAAARKRVLAPRRAAAVPARAGAAARGRSPSSPSVRRRLPEARLPFERPAVLAAMRRERGRGPARPRAPTRSAPAARELARRRCSRSRRPLLALRGGELAAYHGAEHVSIGTYEHGEPRAEGARALRLAPDRPARSQRRRLGNVLAARAPEQLRGAGPRWPARSVRSPRRRGLRAG